MQWYFIWNIQYIKDPARKRQHLALGNIKSMRVSSNENKKSLVN